MKRPFAYFVLALILSILLCACGDATGHGNVTASPWPDLTTPVMPTPTADFSVSPVPDFSAGSNMTENNSTDNNPAVNSGSGTANNATAASTPIPTDDNR